ncbi:TraR/DksA family transcriptional regulator [Parvibaculum sp.]|jgi:DnaK suppressor protein|uniref:TraR/DksA family transcriptional regulator n=1 Tax=Parvibaculum sp. TaxID=2024848 RepID=UPI002FDADE88
MAKDETSTAFEKALRAELDELRAQSETSAQSRATVTLDQQSVGRLSRMDAMQAQAMAQATERRRLARIKQVEAALKRIEDGEYGYCLTCGEEIEAKRLATDPAAPLCIGCSRGGN